MYLLKSISNQKLYLIPCFLSPDIEDKTVTDQTKNILKRISVFLVENEKSARRFPYSLKLNIELEKITFYTLEKDTSKKEVMDFFNEIKKNNFTEIGVISEAGCPGIADPGALAVQYAHQHQIQVIPIAGPSSILLALMASGMNGQSFIFHGYIPIEKEKRIKYIQTMEKDSVNNKRTQIFIETPYRNNQLFKELIDTCNLKTQLCIATDITAPTEFIQTKSIAQWEKIAIDLHKKPTVFLLGNE